MAMNCTPVPTLDDRINDIRMRTAEIINRDILPNERQLARSRHESENWSEHTEMLELRADIMAKVKQAGLWAPHLPQEFGGMGLDFMAHAYMNEVLAYAVGAASLFGVVAPNSGNQKILVKYGTPQQQQDWLLPTIEGTMESGFSMTEPHNPGSDPRALDATAVIDGDHFVINGHKWFTSNGIDADFFIVMCRVVDPNDASRTGRMSQIIVPTATKGVNIVRGIGIWGRRESDHCEVKYEDVRVPVANALGRVGEGHQAAQDRLGAGRIYHCMNCIGQMWRAFDMMVDRAAVRQVRGGLLADQQFTQGAIADSYIDIQTARLFTIHAAEKIDQGLEAARTDISAIKVYVPAAYTRVVDRAIQIWGAAGVSNDLPLWAMYQAARTLRIADGPDEVHKILIAKNVLGAHAKGTGWDFGN